VRPSVRRVAGALVGFALPGGALASPIPYDTLSENELWKLVVLSIVLVSTMGLLALVGFVRYRRQYRRTGEGPRPVVLFVGIAALVVLIGAFFVWAGGGFE